MLNCPTCNRIYEDTTLAFCLDDGSRLTPAYDSLATAPGPNLRETELPPTEKLPPELMPTKASPDLPPTILARFPSAFPPTGSSNQPNAKTAGKLWMILSGTLALLVVGLVILLGYLEWKTNGKSTLAPSTANSAAPSNSNIRSNQNSNAASPAPTPSPQTQATDSVYLGWPLPPLVSGDWVAIDKQGSRKLLDRLMEDSPPGLIGAARQITQFRAKRLSFYPGAKLYEGLVPSAGSGEAGIFSFILLRDGTITLLDGTATPIHELDASVPVVLDTREQTEAYLRFFAAGIFANDGNFRIVDSVEDPLWARDSSESDRQRAAKYIRPLALDRLDDGRWKASATVQFGTELSSVVFYIDPDADSTKVTMAEDVMVASNLPLRREAFNGPIRYELGLYK